jgi:hypothetical protein|tara:strand:+ start:70 stop:789 length:720 start_codon:yes stop_codon:yes gene_type:complete
MKTIITAIILYLLITFNAFGLDYNDDLISSNKSDSAIKYLKPPLSLTVLQNRPQNGLYYFFSNQTAKFNDQINDSPEKNNRFEKIVSSSNIIKKTLRATDPARLAPASIGLDFRGPVTRDRLKVLYKSNPSDILILYRREIKLNSLHEFSNSYFKNPELFLKTSDIKFSIAILTKGLVYISKQKKVLALPSNNQNVSITTSQDDIEVLLGKAVKTGLKILSGEAKKIIQAQKKIITKSY